MLSLASFAGRQRSPSKIALGAQGVLGAQGALGARRSLEASESSAWYTGRDPRLPSPPCYCESVKTLLLLSLLVGVLPARTQAVPGMDLQVAADVAAIPAIDNHAHPPLPPPAGATPGTNPDRDFDALPVDAMEPQTDPVGWRADNPQLHSAWLALWNLDLQPPLDPAGLARLQAARSAVQQREGIHYDEWLLGKAGISVQLGNRVSMGAGVAAPHFRWVPYDDALLYPFSTAGLARETPDKALFFPLEDKLRAQYLRDAGLAVLPKSLAAYVQQEVLPTLARQKAGGAVAIKFELAYLRDFKIADPTESEAEAAYARSAVALNPLPGDSRIVSDYLFRRIATEAGRLGMPVHLHAMAGAGSYFSVAGVNPLLLEPLFNDPRLRHTNFVLLHGGWPYIRELGALLQKPNVFLDISQESLLFPPRTLAGFLREWLEMYPDKILFGTDGYPYADFLGWEESTWIAARNARQALALALSGMLADDELSRTRAHALAEAVLNGTARKLYSF